VVSGMLQVIPLGGDESAHDNVWYEWSTVFAREQIKTQTVNSNSNNPKYHAR
jgi:hypothetical protein